MTRFENENHFLSLCNFCLISYFILLHGLKSSWLGEDIAPPIKHFHPSSSFHPIQTQGIVLKGILPLLFLLRMEKRNVVNVRKPNSRSGTMNIEIKVNV